MKLTKKAILGLGPVIEQMLSTRMAPVISLAIAANHVALKGHIEAIRSAYKPVDGWDEVVSERRAAFEKVGAKPNRNGSYNITPEQSKELDPLMEQIDNDFDTIIKAQDQYDKEFNDALEEKIDIALQVIPAEHLSQDIEPIKLLPLIESELIKWTCQEKHSSAQMGQPKI